MNTSISNKIKLGFAVALITLIFIGVLSYLSIKQFEESARWVGHTNKVLEKIETLSSEIKDIEIEQQGYIITGEESLLSPFRESLQQVDHKISELRQLFADNPEQKQSLEELERVVKQQLSLAEETIATRRSAGFDAARAKLATGSGQSAMSEVWRRVAEMKEREQALLNLRSSQQEKNADLTKATIIIVYILAISFAAMSILFISSDMKARQKAEQELFAVSDIQRAILDTAHYSIISVDKTGTIQTFNPIAQKWLGYTEEEVVGKITPVIIHDQKEIADYAAELSKEYGRQVEPSLEVFTTKPQKGIRDDREWSYIRKDGSRFPVMLSVSALHDSHGNIAGFVGIADDISERKRYEGNLVRMRDAALESASMKSQFLANMSHEIRTPMNGIIGLIRILADSNLSLDQRSLVDTMRTCADSLLIIINDVLDLSKIEAGQLNIESTDFDLRKTIESIIDLMADRAAEKEIELAGVVYNDVPSMLRADSIRLRQVLTNLVGNAIKFTDRGEVIVRVRKESEFETGAILHISVSDTGVGIPEYAQQNLFQAFQQADGSTTRKFGGTGLGLAISKRLVELMGGEIDFESRIGEGSTFWFTLPVEKQKNISVDNPLSVKILDGRRALVVDDNLTTCRLIQSQLLQWKMNCDLATSGEEALDLLRQKALAGTPYDIILIDCSMPGMDGIALFRKIKTDLMISSAKVVMITSVRRRPEFQKMADAGITFTLTKPIRQSQLFDCLLKLINSDSDSLPESHKLTRAIQSILLPANNNVTTGRRILLVEDNRINQQVALHQLTKLGYLVDIADDGTEALEALSKAAYDAILMDCQMPIMDGYRATAEIRKRESPLRRTPIIAMTAHAIEGDRETCLVAGMDDYISKPVDIEELASKLKHWCGSNGSLIKESPRDKADSHKTENNQPEAAGQTSTNRAVIDKAVMASLRTLDPNDEEGLIDKLIDTFLSDALKRMTMLRESIERADTHAIAEAAHALRGSSGNLGAKQLSSMCGDIERRSEEGAFDQVKRIFEEIETEFERVISALQSEKKKA